MSPKSLNWHKRRIPNDKRGMSHVWVASDWRARVVSTTDRCLSHVLGSDAGENNSSDPVNVNHSQSNRPRLFSNSALILDIPVKRVVGFYCLTDTQVDIASLFVGNGNYSASHMQVRHYTSFIYKCTCTLIDRTWNFDWCRFILMILLCWRQLYGRSCQTAGAGINWGLFGSPCKAIKTYGESVDEGTCSSRLIRAHVQVGWQDHMIRSVDNGTCSGHFTKEYV